MVNEAKWWVLKTDLWHDSDTMIVTNRIMGENRKERSALKESGWNMDSSEFSQCDEKLT